MAEDGSRMRLGRGLAALIGEAGEEGPAPDRARGVRRLPVAFLQPNPHNPRRVFRDEDLAELGESIRAKGIVQPIIVRPAPGGTDAHQIIAGERRWRAAQRIGLHDVPVIVVEATDREAMEIALVENVQRADLNALEEAAAYDRLIEDFGYNQAELGTVIGKSRSHVANTLRLQRLPDKVKAYLNDGRLSAGHARALLNQPDPEGVADRIVREGLSVRDVEQISQEARPEAARRAKPDKDADIRAVERSLSDVLGLKVVLNYKGAEGGEMRITYKTLDQLDEVCRRLQG